VARQAKVVITSENKSGAGVKSAISDILGLDDAAKKIGSTLKSAFSVLAIAAAAKEIARFGVDSVKAFGDMERSMLQLRAALGNNEASFGKMTGLIEEMGKKTTASMDDIEHLVAELASLGKSDAEIEKITRASVALSNVTGGSLSESMTKLLAAQEGQTKGLKILVPEIGNLTKEQLAAGGATEVLLAKLGAVSDAMAGGVAQDFSNLTKAADDLKESMGRNLAETFSPAIEWITRLATAWNTSLTAMSTYHRAQKEFSIAAQTEALNALSVELEATGAKRKKREALDAQPGANPNDRIITQSLREKELEIIDMMNETSARLRAISTALPSFGLTQIPNLAGATGGGTGGAPVTVAPSYSDPEGLDWADRRMMFGFGEVGMPEPPEIGLDWADRRQMFGFGEVGTPAYQSSATSGAGLSSGSLNPLAPIMDGLAKLGGGFMSMLGSLSSVSSILDPLSTILGAAMEVLGPLIDEALAPLVGMLKIVGAALGEILTPIVKALGKVIEFVMTGILWVWNGIVKAINWALGWAGVHLAYANLDSASAAGASSSSGSSSSSSGGSGAAYTGAQSITFNFFNQGNVVGSGGLEELAALIDSIITRNARYA
jgi:hypothetical protein